MKWLLVSIVCLMMFCGCGKAEQEKSKTELKETKAKLTEKELVVNRIINNIDRLEFKLEADPALVKAYQDRQPKAPPSYRWYYHWYSKETVENERVKKAIMVRDKPVLTGKHIVKVSWRHTIDHGIMVTLTLDQFGSALFSGITETYSEETLGAENGRCLAIILDDKLESVLSLKTPITNGKIEILIK